MLNFKNLLGRMNAAYLRQKHLIPTTLEQLIFAPVPAQRSVVVGVPAVYEIYRVSGVLFIGKISGQ
jgi:hypothetical protein